MANLAWVARAQKKAQVNRITPASVTVGNIFTVTINQKSYSFTATAATVANVTAGLVALLQASEEPEFRAITWADATTWITATANTPGRPFTQTSSSADGTGSAGHSLTTTTTTANSSPNDVNNGVNYSGGSVPSAADNLTLENSSEPMLWNLDALSAVALGTVTRKRSFTGQVGLPATNEDGYREYLPTEFTFQASNVVWEQSASDYAGMHRLNVGSGTACAVRVEGDGVTALGEEPLYIRGTHASNTLTVTNGSVASAIYAGETSVFSTVRGQNATIRTGAGTTWGTSIYLTDCIFETASNLPATFQQFAGGETYLRGAATGTGPIIDGGAFFVMTSGTISAPAIRTGATFDMSRDPRTRTISGTTTMHAGASYIDPMSTTTPTIQVVGCEFSDVTIVMGPGRTITFS